MEVYLEGQKVKLRGRSSVLTPDVIARVKAHRAELLATLAGPPVEPDNMPRHNISTTLSDLPLVDTPDALTEAQVDAVCRLMDKAGRNAFLWVLGEGGRADTYEHERGFSHRDADLTAAVDYLLHVHKPDGGNRAEQIKNLEAITRQGKPAKPEAEPCRG